MVAGAERADLVAPALDGACADRGRDRRPRSSRPPRCASQILRRAVAAAHRPARAVAQHLARTRTREQRHETARSRPRPARARQSVSTSSRRRGCTSSSVRLVQHQAHAAVDVEADAARRDHAAGRIHRRHAADRKAVAPVRVGHDEARADDAGQAGDVGGLLKDRIVHRVEQLARRVDADRHAHARPPAGRNLPDAVGDLGDQVGRGHQQLAIDVPHGREACNDPSDVGWPRERVARCVETRERY